MKKLIYMSVTAIFLACSALLTSCGKKGCADSAAKNYCDECKKDDGSCQYEGKVVFWYNQATSQALIADNATSLTFYVDGSIVGSCATSVSFPSAPICDQNAAITVTKQLGNVKSKSYSYSIKDDTGWEYWSGVINFDANTCTKKQVVL